MCGKYKSSPWNESVGLAGYRQDREVIIPKLASC